MNWFSDTGDLEALRAECGDPVGFPASDADVLFCDWHESDHSGGFYLLFKRGSEIFEQQLDHCSCNSYMEDSDSWARLPAVSREYLLNRKPPYTPSASDAEAQVAWDAMLELCV